jgi:hypothetical protein
MHGADLMSRRAKKVAVRILLTLAGVFLGWAGAGYAFMYFTGNGMTSEYATGYSIIVGLAIFGAFVLIAFKLNLRE